MLFKTLKTYPILCSISSPQFLGVDSYARATGLGSLVGADILMTSMPFWNLMPC
jgi:hypothetical protein